MHSLVSKVAAMGNQFFSAWYVAPLLNAVATREIFGTNAADPSVCCGMNDYQALLFVQQMKRLHLSCFHHVCTRGMFASKWTLGHCKYQLQ